MSYELALWTVVVAVLSFVFGVLVGHWDRSEYQAARESDAYDLGLAHGQQLGTGGFQDAEA